MEKAKEKTSTASTTSLPSFEPLNSMRFGIASRLSPRAVVIPNEERFNRLSEIAAEKFAFHDVSGNRIGLMKSFKVSKGMLFMDIEAGVEWAHVVYQNEFLMRTTLTFLDFMEKQLAEPAASWQQ